MRDGALRGHAPAHAQKSDKLKKITVLTNYAFFGRHAPLFTGIEKGYFREAGFDVQLLPTTGSGFVNTAIDSNKADSALTDASVLVQSIAKGAKFRHSGSIWTSVPIGSHRCSRSPHPNLSSGAKSPRP